MNTAVSNMSATRLRMIAVMNEISFIFSQRAHGGPEREQELQAFRRELCELRKQEKEANHERG